jgi:hypothetical protein
MWLAKNMAGLKFAIRNKSSVIPLTNQVPKAPTISNISIAPTVDLYFRPLLPSFLEADFIKKPTMAATAPNKEQIDYSRSKPHLHKRLRCN